MYVGYDEDQQALRDELRDYYAQLLTPEVQEALPHGGGVGPAMRKVVKQMGTDGWLGIGWPEEYGGQGRTPIEQFIFFDESMRAGAPVPMLTINTVGPTIMQLRHRRAEGLLPARRSCTGEIHFCIGYTEPGAGTDLAALQTKADPRRRRVRHQRPEDLDEPRQRRRLLWLAVRTDPSAKKHKGISMFVVADGHARHHGRPDARCWASHDINQTFFDDVRVPATNLVGGENDGWKLITNQLNHERVTLCSSGMIEQSLDDVREWAQRHQARRRPPGHRPGVGAAQPGPGARPARVPAPHQLEGRLGGDRGHAATPADASTIKVFGTEFYLEAFRAPDGDHRPAAYLQRATRRARCSPAALEIDVPQPADPHLRRRHQRDPARPHRHVRPRLPRWRPADASESRTDDDMDFSLQRRAGRDLRDLAAADPRRPSRRNERLKELDAGRRPLRPRACGPTLADAGPARHRRPRGARRRWARLPRGRARARADRPHRGAGPVPARRSCSARCRSPQFGTDAPADGAAAAAWSPATSCSPRRWSRSAPTPLAPPTTAAPDGDGWRLDGVEGLRAGRTAAPTASWSPRPPATARSASFVVDPSASGVTREAPGHHRRTSPRPASTLDGVGRRAGDVLGDPDEPVAPIVEWMVEHATAAGCADRHRRVRRGAAPHRRVHQDPRAVRAADRHVPGRRPAGRRRLHRHRGRPAHRVAGGVAARRGTAGHRGGRHRQVLGRRGRPAGRRTRPSTCTAASASTATTRCTATSCGPSRSS